MGLLLLAACSSHDKTDAPPNEPPVDEQHAIVFSSMASEHTRVATPLTAKYKNFGVWAWKGVSPNADPVMMHGQTGKPYFVYNDAKYSGNGSSQQWGYDMETACGKEQFLRYWDLSVGQYDFMAYAPYNSSTATYPPTTAAGVVDNAMNPSASHTLRITGVTGIFNADTPGDNIDWLWAKTRRTMSIPKDEDLIKPENVAPAITDKTATVPLAFHHLLAKVKFCVKYRNQGTVTVTSNVLSLAVTASGNGFVKSADFDESLPSRYDIKSYYTSSLPTHSMSSPGIPFTATAGADNTAVDLTPWLAMIPGQPYSMTVRLRINELGMERDLVTVIEVPSDGVWEMDKQYTYTLVLDPMTHNLNVAVSVADWAVGSTITPPAQAGW